MQCVEDDSVATVDEIPIGRCDAVFYFAADKWVPSQSDRKIRSVVVRRPKKDSLWRWFGQFGQSRLFFNVVFRLGTKKTFKKNVAILKNV